MQPAARVTIATIMCLFAQTSFANIITSGIDSGSAAVGYLSDAGRPSGYTYKYFSGTFDISDELAPTSYEQPYDISSGRITLNFADDVAGDVGLQSQSGRTLINHYWIGHIANGGREYFDYRVDRTYFDAFEAVTLSVGDQSTSAASNYQATSYMPSGSQIWQHTTTNDCYVFLFPFGCADYGEGENHYWTDYFYSRTYGYSGNFSIGIDLSDLNLGDLANDGLLNFSLGVAGDLNLLSATLTADVNETSITPAASIPNPPTLALIGIAMLGLGRIRPKISSIDAEVIKYNAGGIMKKLLIGVISLLYFSNSYGAFLYGIDITSDNLFSIDTTTGDTSNVGNLGVSWGFGGIAFNGNDLYGISANYLYSINTENGQAAFIGNTGMAGLESLAIINGVGYSIGTVLGAPAGQLTLFSVDLATGSASPIGTRFSGNYISSLTSVGSALFGIEVTADGSLVQLDPTSGDIVDVVGTSGLSDVTSLAWADDSFWTIPAYSNVLYSINSSDANAIQVASSSKLNHVSALAAKLPTSFSVPSPTPISLLILGLAGLSITRRRQN